MGNSEGKYKSKRTGKYISLAWFRAYDKDMSEFWLDDKKPLREQIELRIIDICHTAIIDDIVILDNIQNC